MSKNNRTRTNRTVEALPITALPFVEPSEHGRPHCWTVPPAGQPLRDPREAEAIGHQYAIQFAQWLQAYPELVGMGLLGWIAADIDFHDTERTGYWIGFFSRIERVLYAAGAAA